jgi:prefoldin subunit 5
MQQAMQVYLTQLNQQIQEYQANVNNLLEMLGTIQSQQAAVATWLANNPG